MSDVDFPHAWLSDISVVVVMLYGVRGRVEVEESFVWQARPSRRLLGEFKLTGRRIKEVGELYLLLGDGGGLIFGGRSRGVGIGVGEGGGGTVGI